MRLKAKSYTSTILTIVGALGVVATAAMAARDSKKAVKLVEEKRDEKGEELTPKETVLAAAPAYIPTAITVGSTIACIFGANLANKQTQASIASAYALVNHSYKQYQDNLKELYGEEADEAIREAMVREHHDFHQIDLNTPDRKVTFLEPISGHFIERYEIEINDAEYHLNRNFVLRGYASLNEFYEFLGLPKTEEGEKLGWTSTDGYFWLDFEHILCEDKDGNEFYEIAMIFNPDEEYLEEWE